MKNASTVSEDTASNQEPTLHRGLHNRHIQLIALGGAIGTGLFLGIAQKLSKSDMLEISKRAAFHLSVFVAWLAKHDFLNPQSDGFNLEDAQKLKNETITGTDYLFKHLDEKLYSSDISDTLLPFISDFYENYMDFCYTVLVDDVARTEFDWKIYHLVEEDIDEMFSQYKNIK